MTFPFTLQFRKSIFKCRDSLVLYQCLRCDYSSNEKIKQLSHTCGALNKSEVKRSKCDQCGIGSYSILWTFLHKRKYKEHKNSRKCMRIQSQQCSWLLEENKPAKSEKFRQNCVVTVNQFLCKDCSFQTVSNDLLSYHVKLVHGAGSLQKFICGTCGYKTVSLTKFNYHTAREHSIYKCHLCTFTTYRNYSLQRHTNSKHTPDAQAIWYECDQCTYKSRRKEHLQKHNIAKHSTKDKLKCIKCSFSAVTRDKLNLHVLRKHVPKELLEWQRCDECYFKTKCWGGLKKHIKRVHPT